MTRFAAAASLMVALTLAFTGCGPTQAPTASASNMSSGDSMMKAEKSMTNQGMMMKGDKGMAGDGMMMNDDKMMMKDEKMMMKDDKMMKDAAK